jgi:hypothetical protein
MDQLGMSTLLTWSAESRAHHSAPVTPGRVARRLPLYSRGGRARRDEAQRAGEPTRISLP